MIKRFKQYIIEKDEKINFTNWIKPSNDDIALEYKIEYEIKPLKQITGDAFPTLQSFIDSVNKAKILVVTPEIDKKIQYRSHTKNKKDLLSLIRGYASYPKYRNEKTIESIYDAFKQNKPMKMPIVLIFPNRTMRIMSGNTRMDIARQLGIDPHVLLVKVPEKR
jgi:hypothetical protein